MHFLRWVKHDCKYTSVLKIKFMKRKTSALQMLCSYPSLCSNKLGDSQVFCKEPACNQFEKLSKSETNNRGIFQWLKLLAWNEDISRIQPQWFFKHIIYSVQIISHSKRDFIISISHLCGGSSQKTILKLVLFLYCILNPLINIHCLPFFFFLTLGQDSVSAHYKFNIVTELQIWFKSMACKLQTLMI